MTKDKSIDKRPSVAMLVFSAAATAYFIWALFIAGGERSSFLLTFVFGLALLANIVFLVSALLRWRK